MRRVLMRKICQIHGPFEDVLATDAAFFRRMERLYPGPDFAAPKTISFTTTELCSLRPRCFPGIRSDESLQHEVLAAFYGRQCCRSRPRA
jgi:hypothetical protein